MPGDVFARSRAIHLLVDVQDLAVRTYVKGPAVGDFSDPELAEIGEHAVFPGGLPGGIGQNREVGFFFLGEGGVVGQRIDADHEVGNVERANQWAALTEGSALSGS